MIDQKKSLAQRDVACVWHPFTQMQTAELPIVLEKAKGVWLHTEDGRKILDGISSWWVNVHGHGHPYLAKALADQFSTLDHTIFAGFTHPKAIELAERLLPHLPGQDKAFFSDNGSTSVEVGIKMAIQYWANQKQTKTRIIAFEEAYHGDTFGAMSVSGRSPFNAAFDSLLFEVESIPLPLPGQEEESYAAMQKALQKGDVAAFIFEPLVQAAGGMRMYSVESLDKLVGLAQEKKVICIADEVFTGFGRTGKLFACDYLTNKPDIRALSKGITGGTMALGLTTCTADIYDAFLSEDKYKAFFHGHSYTGNALACSLACASLDIFETEESQQQRVQLQEMQEAFATKMKDHPAVENVRVRGTIVAMDVKTGSSTSYFNTLRDEMYQHFLDQNILLRPLGNVLYFLPPYCISKEDVLLVHNAIVAFAESRCSVH